MTKVESTRQYVIPSWVSWTHGVLLLAALAFYCFLVYALIRPLFGTIGFDVATSIKALLATCILSMFIIWLFPLADLPLLLFLDRLPRARVRKGKCPLCGYPKPPTERDAICTECGTSGEVPPAWHFNKKTARRFSLFLLCAILLGSASAESLLLIDEFQFTAQAKTQNFTKPGSDYTRPRAWPASFATMTYTPENGTESTSFLKSERIRKWMREDS